MWFSEYHFLERSWAKNESTLKSEIVMRYHHQPHALNIIIVIIITRDSDRNRNGNRNGIRRKHWRNVGLAFNCTFLLFGSVIQLIACASNIEVGGEPPEVKEKLPVKRSKGSASGGSLNTWITVKNSELGKTNRESANGIHSKRSLFA
ncbi:hypothetical protein VIGAN_UM180300 [Vigna angularis var. angularis]|uniref:Uncharacterized protein n=1 Tax=Vigna angularis var. angularis TaxID=157739 RepID=A0A0S3TFD0_PHAAN|nr:hypothetical protein VIGAN_UM180300 [Vigna angularis var. angularis]